MQRLQEGIQNHAGGAMAALNGGVLEGQCV